MSEVNSHATELTSQYVAQVTGDLERNAKEQERVGAEIEALQEQLRALQHDHTVLVNMQEALGGPNPVVEADAASAPSVPHQASAERKPSKGKKAAATGAKKTASKKPAAKPAVKAAVKAAAVTAPTAATKQTLVELIRGHLEQQSEPRSAAEITTALTQAHPDRSVKTTVVRTTLEGLVAKSHAHRTKQGSSVFYTTVAASEPAPAEPQPEAVAG
ncbi:MULTISPECIES: hypothetical protein [unclassified Streptomyces]|jgi:hypothetical protein|uniref:hypothetical protein n=1 Tax=unclassified Streptomyces TaxID=2593676 RepID=UPI00224FCAA2|nr:MULTISPECIES: hypothetical protein [unclassified Streptomyces]MCX4402504.1 hypothetical protein [Streptomyces sp. NBC_01764]MCX5182522.1 hypothetical protein [Streptomyces sp. NBC_00268]